MKHASTVWGLKHIPSRALLIPFYSTWASQVSRDTVPTPLGCLHRGLGVSFQSCWNTSRRSGAVTSTGSSQHGGAAELHRVLLITTEFLTVRGASIRSDRRELKSTVHFLFCSLIKSFKWLCSSFSTTVSTDTEVLFTASVSFALSSAQKHNDSHRLIEPTFVFNLLFLLLFNPQFNMNLTLFLQLLVAKKKSWLVIRGNRLDQTRRCLQENSNIMAQIFCCKHPTMFTDRLPGWNMTFLVRYLP